MNTDIRLSVSFKGHRKRRKLRLILGDNATDYLIDLWISTAMNHPTGRLEGMDEIDIALEAGWEKDPKTFIDALLRCGFLDHHDGGYALHDWEEHQGYAIHAEARSAKAKKAAEKRWNAPSNAPSMKFDAPSNAPSMKFDAPSPSPSPSPSPAPAPAPAPQSPPNGKSVGSNSSCAQAREAAAHTPSAMETVPTTAAAAEAAAPIRKVKAPKAELLPPIEIPDWIPADAWLAFVDNRKALKAPLTRQAIVLAIKKLDRWRQEGRELGEILEQSAMNGWKGLFIIDRRPAGKDGRPPTASPLQPDIFPGEEHLTEAERYGRHCARELGFPLQPLETPPNARH